MKRLDTTFIKDIFIKMNFLFESGIAFDIDENKYYIRQVVLLGSISNTETAYYYVNTYGSYSDYIDYKEAYELYNYINHKALQEEVKSNGCTDIGDFIDYKSLGKDMFEKDFLYQAFYRFEDDVFEITVEDTQEYIDPDIVENCYVSVKKLIDDGYEINTAVDVVKGVSHGENT